MKKNTVILLLSIGLLQGCFLLQSNSATNTQNAKVINTDPEMPPDAQIKSPTDLATISIQETTNVLPVNKIVKDFAEQDTLIDTPNRKKLDEIKKFITSNTQYIVEGRPSEEDLLTIPPIDGGKPLEQRTSQELQDFIKKCDDQEQHYMPPLGAEQHLPDDEPVLSPRWLECVDNRIQAAWFQKTWARCILSSRDTSTID